MMDYSNNQLDSMIVDYAPSPELVVFGEDLHPAELERITLPATTDEEDRASSIIQLHDAEFANTDENYVEDFSNNMYIHTDSQNSVQAGCPDMESVIEFGTQFYALESQPLVLGSII